MNGSKQHRDVIISLQLIIPWEAQVNSFYNCNVSSPSEVLPRGLLCLFSSFHWLLFSRLVFFAILEKAAHYENTYFNTLSRMILIDWAARQRQTTTVKIGRIIFAYVDHQLVSRLRMGTFLIWMSANVLCWCCHWQVHMTTIFLIRPWNHVSIKPV